jgi:hypothetical protein
MRRTAEKKPGLSSLFVRVVPFSSSFIFSGFPVLMPCETDFYRSTTGGIFYRNITVPEICLLRLHDPKRG